MPDENAGNRMECLERLLEVSRHLGSFLELDSLLQAVVAAACELTDSEHSSILLYEEETDLLKFIAGTYADRDVLKRLRIPLQQSTTGKVYTDCLHVVINQPASNNLQFRDFDKLPGIHVSTFLAVPMVFRGQPIGVVEAVNKRGGKLYLEDDAMILETLASHAAAALLSTLMLDEMKQAYSDLEESERKKTDFIAIASHELRTPLGLILGHASDLYDNCPDPEIHAQLDVIYNSAKRLKKIVDNFSSISSYQPPTEVRPNQKRIEVITLLQKVVESFNQAVRNKGILLFAELPHDELFIFGDPEKLFLAFSNLMDNAISFSNEKGRILITAERLAGYAKISIIDNGIGIPARELNKIFEKFYQVEDHLTRRHGGIGVGLAVAKAMIEMHDGQIWVESVEGKGSNFSVLLPIKNSSSAVTSSVMPGSSSVKPFSL